MLKHLFQICLYVSFVANLGVAVKAATGQEPSDTMVYENRNQIDPKPLKLHSIHGIAKDEDGSLIPSMKVGIFTDGTHALIAVTSTDRNGTFSFSHIPAGKYRLVAEYPAFCTANVPILVDARPAERSAQAVELHMRVGGIDVCSFGSLSRSAKQNEH